jgi:hypothetical protein
MIEYRVQVENFGHWVFATDGSGKYYSYPTLGQALRYGPMHYPALLDDVTCRYVRKDGRIVRDHSRGRIVMSNAEWTVVE